METNKDRNVFWHETHISREEREKIKNHLGYCLWFTGLSASGKSTIANILEKRLVESDNHTYLLDGDNIRHRLNKDLGFSDEDREENIRRIGEVANLFVDAGLGVLTAFISPFRKDRDLVRDLLPEGRFIEIFVDCDLEVCEQRDPKGLYKKARNNEIKEFTGISSPYEPPENPELILKNNVEADIEKNVEIILDYLKKNKIIDRTNNG